MIKEHFSERFRRARVYLTYGDDELVALLEEATYPRLGGVIDGETHADFKTRAAALLSSLGWDAAPMSHENPEAPGQEFCSPQYGKRALEEAALADAKQRLQRLKMWEQAENQVAAGGSNPSMSHEA